MEKSNKSTKRDDSSRKFSQGSCKAMTVGGFHKVVSMRPLKKRKKDHKKGNNSVILKCKKSKNT